MNIRVCEEEDEEEEEEEEEEREEEDEEEESDADASTTKRKRKADRGGASDGLSLAKKPRHKSQLCQHEGCTKSPNYNSVGEKGKRFCSGHKLPGMVIVRVGKTCEKEGCSKVPTYNTEGE